MGYYRIRVCVPDIHIHVRQRLPHKVEWIAINGKEFYQLITSPAGKGRYFIDMDEFMIESTEAEYKDWRREKDHSDYLRKQEETVQLLSLCGGQFDEDGGFKELMP